MMITHLFGTRFRRRSGSLAPSPPGHQLRAQKVYIWPPLGNLRNREAGVLHSEETIPSFPSTGEVPDFHREGGWN